MVLKCLYAGIFDKVKWNTKLAVGWFKFYNYYLHMKWINHLVMPCWSGVFNNFKAK